MIFDRLSDSTLKLRRALGIQTLLGAAPDDPSPRLPDHIRNARPAPLPGIETPRAPRAPRPRRPSEGEAEDDVLTGADKAIFRIQPVQPETEPPPPADPIRSLPHPYPGESEAGIGDVPADGALLRGARFLEQVKERLAEIERTRKAFAPGGAMDGLGNADMKAALEREAERLREMLDELNMPVRAFDISAQTDTEDDETINPTPPDTFVKPLAARPWRGEDGASAEPRDDDERNGGDARRPSQATEATSTAETPSFNEPLPAEKLQKQIELGEKGMRRLDEIIEHQKRMLSRLIARDENYESPTGLPPEAKDLGEKIKGLQSFFRASNYSLIYLSIFDQFDRAIITPRTINQLRRSIRELIKSRGDLAQQIQDARDNLRSNGT